MAVQSTSGTAGLYGRLGALLATLGAGVLLALVVAHWGWRWLGPSTTQPAQESVAAPSTEAIVTAGPFGRAAQPASTAAVPAATASALPPDARLLGVFAGRDGGGYALLRLPDRGAILVKSGGTIASGVVLEAVYANGIRVRERGAARDIALRPDVRAMPSVPSPAVAPLPRPAAAAAMPVRSACAPPAGFAGPVYRLNAELLSGMAAQPQSWSALLVPASGALVVRDETGLAAMLGMKAGDRVVEANGIALGAIDDVLTAVVKPLAASQPVRVTGARDGKSREWLFLNATACPA